MKSFVLRVEVDEINQIVGVVERVRTGEKERFLGYGMLVDVLMQMVAAEDVPPPHPINAQEGRS